MSPSKLPVMLSCRGRRGSIRYGGDHGSGSGPPISTLGFAALTGEPSVGSHAAPTQPTAASAQAVQVPSTAKWCGLIVRPTRSSASLARPSKYSSGASNTAPHLSQTKCP